MVEASRVAEIIAERPDGTVMRGSGYRTATTDVLTAAHVIEHATGIKVRFDADTDTEWETVATCRWSEARADLAVLSIPSRGDELLPARFGRIGEAHAVLPATAVGFPLWKLKIYDGPVVARYRDTHQASGMVAALSNRREGTLEFTVTPPERDTDPDVSPWQGMSGAALWIGDRIVGVIARHHRSDGLGRLAAVRLVPEVPGLIEPLPDVIRPRVSDLILTNYRKQVEAIAPENLLDREDELADLTRFVAGDEPYKWWQAGPWAGKSALMAWFVLHPPEGVDVVSFFVTGRLAAQEDCEAFTKELTLQLAALTGEHLPDVLALDGCQNQLWRLLVEAAEQSGRNGRRLVLVVDGLDEDAGAAHGKPSIASLLPRRLPDNVRIVLASRPDPQVPADVLDEDHPLLTCTRQTLAVSRHARSMERRAVNELNRHLTGDDLHREVLGLITAAGGGLTRSDLEELTDRPPYEIDRLLDGLLGRTISSRPAPLRPADNKPVHLFAHETLAQVAREKFGSAVRSYRTRLHEWADAYQEQGWPPETPRYLLLGYPHLLVDAGDHERLVAVATDRARHNRMLATSGGDALAASEVRLAQDVLRGRSSPDLSALVLLAAHSDELARRNSGIPERLPLVWMMLGEPARAEALARGITDLQTRARSLVALADFAVRAGDHKRFDTLVTDARTLTQHLSESSVRDDVMSELAAVAAAGDPDLAFSIVREVRDDRRQEDLLAQLATSAGVAGDYALALRFASTIPDEGNLRTETLTELAWSAVLAGRFEQAWALLDSTIELFPLVNTVEKFVRQAVDADEYERAHGFLNAITHRHAQTFGLMTAAAAAAANREYEHALTFARDVADPDKRARAAVVMVETVTATGPLPLAARALLTDAEDTIRALPNPRRRSSLQSRLARAVTWGEEYESVQATMRDALAHRERVLSRAEKTLPDMVMAAARTGDHDRATRLLHHIQDPDERDRVLARLAEEAWDVGEYELAGKWVSCFNDTRHRIVAQVELIEKARAAGKWHLAATVLRATTEVVWDETDTMVDLAAGMTVDGDTDVALTLVRDISSPNRLPDVLFRLAEAVISAGDPDRARVLLAEITSVIDALPAHQDRSPLLAQAVGVAVAVGAHDQAMTLANSIADTYLRSVALTRLAETVAATGEHRGARDLAVRAETLARNAADVTPPVVTAALAVASFLTGEEDRARRLAQGIADPADRAHALATLAYSAPAGGSETGQVLLADAVAAANDMPDPAGRADALTELVGVAADQPDVLRSIIADAEDAITAEVTDVTRAYLLARLARATTDIGHHHSARTLFTKAESLANAVPSTDQWHTVRAELVSTATALGELERARVLTNDITDAELLVWLAREASDAGHHDLALSVILGINSDVGQDHALAALIEHIAVSGDHTRARSLASATTNPFLRAVLLAWLARVATVNGDHELALSLVRDIPDYQRGDGLVWLVRAAVAAGDHERAEALAREVPAPDQGEAARYLNGELPAAPGLYTGSSWSVPLIDVLIATGDRASALAIAHDITVSALRTPELIKLVAAEVAAGDLERAVAVAGEVTEPASRAVALSTVVEAAAANGDMTRARSLLAEVLVLGQWCESVELVARVAPDALVPVLDELEARVRS